MPPTGGGRWASRKSAVRDLLIFPVSIFSSSVPNTPHRSQKHCGCPTLKEALDQNSRLPRTQLRSLTMDGNGKRRPAAKPGFFLQKKSKLCLLLLSQFQRILKPGLLLEAQWSPPGVRGRPGTVALPVTTHPSCDLPSQASPAVASVFLLWLLLPARSRAALQVHPTHNFLRSNTNIPLGTPFYSPGSICCRGDQFQIFQSPPTFQRRVSQNEVREPPDSESPGGSVC